MIYQLEKHIADLLKDFFNNYEFIDKVVVFGSRAKHNANPKSDIDLCVYSSKMSDKEFSKLRLEIDDLPILQKLDVVHFEKVNAELQSNVEKDGKLLYTKVKKVKLSEILKVKTGKYDANHEDINGKYDFFTCALKPSKSNTFSFDDEVIILPGNGANVGEVIYYNGKLEAYQRTYVLHEIKCNVRYLYYILKSNWKKHTLKNEVGSATNYIKLAHITDFKIPFLDLNQQKQIVKTLDKANELINLRKESITKLDALAKSIFIDMFGDPVSNPKGWELVTFDKLIEIKPKSIKPENIQELDKYVGLENIEKDLGNLINIKNAINEDLKSNKFYFDENTILYGKLRPYLNKVALPSFSGVCSTDILPIKVINANKLFIVFIIRHNSFVEIMTSRATGANLPRVNQSDLLTQKVFNPPIELQNKFATIIEKIKEQKSLYEKELEKLEENFQALLQKSFQE